MGFSGQEYWSGSPFSSSGNLPEPEIEPASPARVGGLFIAEPPGKITATWQQSRRAPCRPIPRSNGRETAPPSLSHLWVMSGYITLSLCRSLTSMFDFSNRIIQMQFLINHMLIKTPPSPFVKMEEPWRFS